MLKKAILIVVVLLPFISGMVLAVSQSRVDAAIADKLVKYDAIQEAIVKDNVVMVSVTDASYDGKVAAIRAIASCLIYGYVSTNTDTAAFYIIYLKQKTAGGFHDIGKSEVYGAEIEDAMNGGIDGKVSLGDKILGRLSDS